jgi:serine/threonine-protein kinase
LIPAAIRFVKSSERNSKIMIGQQVGTYKIVEKLSEGGMGAVYKAVDTMLDREVAIKVLRPEFARQTTIVERFRLEAVTLAKLNHPNIATLHSFFGQGDELFMILEYVDGVTLDKALQQRGKPLSCEEAIPIFCELLNCISHAHEFGVIHRDIKPANIMLTEKGTLKVLDFGIARLRGSARITRSGNIIGTLEYMSPEQTKGLETDARSDIYSLGMTLYEILTGKTPFDSDNEFELIQKQIGEMPPDPRSINPDIPKEIEAAIIKSYSKNPDERFQTATEFRETLLDACSFNGAATENSKNSFSKSFATHPLQSNVWKPSPSKNTFWSPAVESPETVTVEIVKDKQISGKDAEPTGNTIDINTPSLQNQTATGIVSDTSDEFETKTSLKKLRRLNYVIGGAGFLVLLALLLGSPFYFSKRSAGGEEESPRAESQKSSQTINQTEEQKPDIVAIPIVETAEPSAQATPMPEPKTQIRVKSKPVSSEPPPAKKKESRESNAERLRRAEKLLTGQ